MNCEIIDGKLVLIPSSETELYAINQWLNRASFEADDMLRMEKKYIRFTAVKVDVSHISSLDVIDCSTMGGASVIIRRKPIQEGGTE